MIALAAILLLAFDRPLGGGTANFIARFDTAQLRPIPAIFLGEADAVPPIEWFLDGDGFLAPLAVSRFVPRPAEDDPPGLARGEFHFAHQGVTKPTLFRGVIRTTPPREVRLLLFPPDHFDTAWKRLAESKIAVQLSGDLPGLRPLLDEHGVAWREANFSKPETIDRNGILIAEPGKSKQIPVPDMAKYMAVFDTESLAFNSFYQAGSEDRMIVYEGPVADFSSSPLAQQMLLQLLEVL